MTEEIADLLAKLEATERDARALVDGLSEELGRRSPAPGAWSVAECVDHLATANRVYLAAMRAPAEQARAAGRFRTRPAKPGFAGRMFLAQIEPPPKWWSRLKAPGKIRPRVDVPPLAQTFQEFLTAEADVHAFLRANADLDLARIRFRNPFESWIYFSLATGLHVIEAHNRRHLLQAWNARRAVEGMA